MAPPQNRRRPGGVPAGSRGEASAGIILLVATVLAASFANSHFAASYAMVWQYHFASLSLGQWVNDGLMSIFFLAIGLEIRRELTRGQLSTRARAALPVVAALGGMVVPILIYWTINRGAAGRVGWGVPMATDIAFVMGALALFGGRLGKAAKTYLLALAIVDDLGAVLVIALFYTDQIHFAYLIAGIGILALIERLGKTRVQHAAVYLASGAVAWLFFLKSGFHAPIAGFLLALVVPASAARSLEPALQPWVRFFIMPIFALANANVSFAFGGLGSRVAIGIVAGLVLGKPIGILAFSWAAVRSGFAALPERTTWLQLFGIASLAGIGFTMSIFVANLAFADAATIEVAKFAVIVASLASACLGAGALVAATRQDHLSIPS